MKVDDKVRHIPTPSGSTLGEGVVLEVRKTVLVNFHDYEGRMNPRWMHETTLEVVQPEPTISNWFFAHFLFLPFVWVMDKLGIRP